MATLDSTVGGATANSYVSDAEFVDFLADRPNAPAIGSASDRANLLIAAQHDMHILLEWAADRVGPRQTDSQALRFPAVLVRNRYDDGYYPEGTIPDFAKSGQMEQAIARFSTDVSAPVGDAIEMVKVDVVQIEFKAGSAPTPAGTVFSDAAAREVAWWVEEFYDSSTGDAVIPLVLV